MGIIKLLSVGWPWFAKDSEMHYYTSTAYRREGIFGGRSFPESSLTLEDNTVRGITRGVTFNIPPEDIINVFTERRGLFSQDLVIETKYTVYKLRRLKAPRRAQKIIASMINA